MKHEFCILNDDNVINITNNKAVVIGRGVKTTLGFIGIDNQTVSAKHCVIAIKEDTENPCFWVWDLGSKNKTIVNGYRVLDGASPAEEDKGCPVYHGDFALIGEVKVKFLISKRKSNVDGTL